MWERTALVAISGFTLFGSALDLIYGLAGGEPLEIGSGILALIVNIVLLYAVLRGNTIILRIFKVLCFVSIACLIVVIGFMVFVLLASKVDVYQHEMTEAQFVVTTVVLLPLICGWLAFQAWLVNRYLQALWYKNNVRVVMST